MINDRYILNCEGGSDFGPLTNPIIDIWYRAHGSMGTYIGWISQQWYNVRSRDFTPALINYLQIYLSTGLARSITLNDYVDAYDHTQV